MTTINTSSHSTRSQRRSSRAYTEFGERLSAKAFSPKQGVAGTQTAATRAERIKRRRHECGPGPPSSSARGRQDHARWAASALVASGKVETTAINSITDLVVPPDRAHAIGRYVHELHGEQPWADSMRVLEVLLMLAKFEAKLPKGSRSTRSKAGMTTSISKTGRCRLHAEPAS